MTEVDLKRFRIFAELGEEDREAVVELLAVRELPTGKSIFREGAEGDGLVLLAEGCLNLKSKSSHGYVGSLRAPDHLGAASLVALGRREVTAVSDGPVVVWILSRTGFARLAEDAPRAAFRIASTVAAELASLARRGIEAVQAQEAARETSQPEL